MDLILPEIVSIGIYNSQIAVKNKSVTNNRKTTMFEIEIPIEDGGVSYIDSESSKIYSDIVICAKPGQIRHTKLPFKCYYIHMIIENGLLYETLLNIPSYIKTQRKEIYKGIFEKLCKYYDSALENDRLMVHGLILELIHLLTNDSQKQYYKDNKSGSNRLVIDKAIKYIKDNITEDLALESVAKYVNLSPVHFHNRFKSATGKTLHQYVEERRIKKASHLLITTDWSLTRISAEVGFSSQSYFSFVFKRVMNMTPREYAKSINERYEFID